MRVSQKASPEFSSICLLDLQVDDRLGGEGTGKILGIGGAEGWAIIGAFAATWAIFYASTRELGGDAGDDSGMTL